MNFESNFKAALFDLDGVVFDTESQYTLFWRNESQRYHPEISNLEYLIKGQTLDEILFRFFADVADQHDQIIARLNEFEQNMEFIFVDGFESFASKLRKNKVRTAIVTSSNNAKMSHIYNKIDGFKNMVDLILTSDNFTESKPSPQCYLKAANMFGIEPRECVVFEDSFNGLKSGRAAGMTVVGLATSNSRESISELSDYVIDNFIFK